jgi:hypothetical protein
VRRSCRKNNAHTSVRSRKPQGCPPASERNRAARSPRSSLCRPRSGDRSSNGSVRCPLMVPRTGNANCRNGNRRCGSVPFPFSRCWSISLLTIKSGHSPFERCAKACPISIKSLPAKDRSARDAFSVIPGPINKNNGDSDAS